MISLIFICLIGFAFGGVHEPAIAGEYQWTRVTQAAEFPEGYNYPVFMWGEKMVAINNGTWLSGDGRNWRKGPLPAVPSSAYQRYVLFKGQIYWLGSVDGNYQKFSVTPRIVRTRDLENWETVSENSNLPKRIFYGTVVFGGRIWMFGGFDGKNYLNDVWNSEDGVRWTRVSANAPWSPRTPSVVTVFKDEIWLMGGGVIDGDAENNPNSEKEVWVSKDGRSWRRIEADLHRKWRGAPIVFDNKLWLVGANRGGTFESAVWVTGNGTNWTELSAPWSPRGGVAVWVKDNTLYMTGGKSSHVENGETKFVYSNDVWAMDRKGE